MGERRREYIRAIHLPDGSQAAAKIECDPFTQPLAILFVAMAEATGMTRLAVAYPDSFWDGDVKVWAWSDDTGRRPNGLTMTVPARRWRALPW